MTKEIFNLELAESEKSPLKGFMPEYSIMFQFEDEPLARKSPRLPHKSSDQFLQNNILVLPSKESRKKNGKWNILYFAQGALDECSLEYGLDSMELKKAIIKAERLKKSIWIDQLLHRLVFEIQVCKKKGSRAAIFCVLELIKEIYYAKPSISDKLVFDTDSSDIRLQKALATIEADLEFLWTADGLGKKVGTSTATLGRLFKKEFGVSTMEFIWDLRLRKAFALLNNTSMAVGEIAFAVGFESLAGFSTAFKRKFGHSPKDLRLKISS